MRKENLQEATQRALLEGYKNLNENKSLKKEGKISNKSEKDTFKNSIGFTDEEMKKLGMEFEDDELEESKQRDFKAEFLALPEKEQEKYKKCIPPLRRGLSNVEAETIAKEKGLDAGILWWVTNIGQLTNFKESKKVEDYDFNKIDSLYNQGTTELEKAFTTEVKYWLQTLIDEKSNDEIGKKATSVIEDDAKVKEIVDELVNGSDDLWEDIHMKIENLAGIDVRRYNDKRYESKKDGLTESVDESKVNLYDTVWDVISSYDEEYAQEQGIDKLDDEDVYNIIAEIIGNPDVQSIIREEIESYAGYKNS